MASLLLFFCGRKAFQATFATALVLLSLALAVWAFTAPASWNEDELRALRAFRDEKKVELAAAVLDTGYEVAPPCDDWNARPCKSTFGMERVEQYCADENAMFIPDFSASINVSDGNQSTDTKRRLDNGCNGTSAAGLCQHGYFGPPTAQRVQISRLNFKKIFGHPIPLSVKISEFSEN